MTMIFSPSHGLKGNSIRQEGQQISTRRRAMSCPKGAQTIAIKMEGPNNPVKFTVASWNSTGSNTVKMNYFYKYCLENNIVCGNLQETFKTGNSNYFSKLFKEYSCSAKNAIRQLTNHRAEAPGVSSR